MLGHAGPAPLEPAPKPKEAVLGWPKAWPKRGIGAWSERGFKNDIF